MTVSNPKSLITEFSNAFKKKHGNAVTINHQFSAAGQSHTVARITPPDDEAWVYVFSTTVSAQIPAGANRALRVGRTASFGRLSQHYGAAGMTANGLVQQLSSQYFHWAYLGLDQNAESMNSSIQGQGWKATWGNWVKNNLDRDIFILNRGQTAALHELEKFMRGRLGPVFEG